MSLFQKKPLASSSVPLYTLGLQKTVLLVGLGNIGIKYNGTRHNIGFDCVDNFVLQQGFDTQWIEKKDLKCQLTSSSVGDTRVIVIKPTTLMNLSGKSVQSVAHFYKIEPSNIIVVHDELDIDFGQIRMRTGGSSAGHNGIESIVDSIGEGFSRIRIGIGNNQTKIYDSKDYVLGKFNSEEQKQLSMLKKEVASILIEYVVSGNIPHDTRNFLI